MSEQELYEIASARVNRRNRRWMWWTLSLGVMILTVPLLIVLSETAYETWGIIIMLGWAAVFVPHTIITTMADSRDEDIAKEIAKLHGAVYEKPKRLYLDDEGELVDDAPVFDELPQNHNRFTSS